MTHPPARMDGDGLRARVIAALPSLAGMDGWSTPDVACRVWPDRVRECGVLACGPALYLYLSPPVDPTDAGAVQVVLDLPPGRYLVDTYDIARGTWVARESSLAPPLVAGIPERASALILRVSPWVARAAE